MDKQAFQAMRIAMLRAEVGASVRVSLPVKDAVLAYRPGLECQRATSTGNYCVIDPRDAGTIFGRGKTAVQAWCAAADFLVRRDGKSWTI